MHNHSYIVNHHRNIVLFLKTMIIHTLECMCFFSDADPRIYVLPLYHTCVYTNIAGLNGDKRDQNGFVIVSLEILPL